MKSTIKKRTEGYGYKYTELADINKYCETNDIRYYQETETCEINGKDYIITFLIQNGETTRHRGCQVVDAVLQGIKNPVQEYGSSITYCRRYSLLMALGLATEDDDAAGLTELTEDTAGEFAKNYKFAGGKHKDWTLEKVIKEDKSFLKWLVNNSKDQQLLKAIELLTGTKIPTEAESKAKQELMVRLNNLVTETDCDYEALKEHYKVKSNNEMTINQLKEAIAELEKRLPEEK